MATNYNDSSHLNIPIIIIINVLIIYNNFLKPLLNWMFCIIGSVDYLQYLIVENPAIVCFDDLFQMILVLKVTQGPY